MRYIDSWLTGLGLEYIIPKLKANGITTPKKLALLNLRDMYEVVGVEDAEDRKKLYFLIQRLSTILNSKQNQDSSQGEEDEPSDRGTQSPARSPKSPVVRSGEKPRTSRASAAFDDVAAKSTGTDRSEEDLRVLRRNKRMSLDSAMPPSSAAAAAPMVDSGAVPYVIKSNRLSSRVSVGGAPSAAAAPVSSAAIDELSGGVRGMKLHESASSDHIRVNNRRTDVPPPPRDDEDSTPPPVLSARGSRAAHTTATASAAAAPAKPGRAPASQQREQPRVPSPPPPAAPPVAVGNNRPQSVRRGVQSPPMQRPPSAAEQRQQQQQQRRTPSPPDSPPPPSKAPTASAAAAGSRAPSRPPSTVSAVPSVVSSSSSRPPSTAHHANNDDDDEGNNIEDMAIRVVVRKRPISRQELAKGDRDVMDIEPGGGVYVHEPKTKVDLTKVIETQKFTFDDAFGEHDTNELIYRRTIKHLVSFVFEGGKASCFAYGQTGSGKTFSMMGSRPDAPAEATVNAGLYVLAARDIFMTVKKPKYSHLKVLVSCFEIYGGKLFDLLNDRGVVKCLEDAKQQVQLPGLTEHLVRNVEELLDLMASAHQMRSTGSTGANSESSRSHQIMQIVLRDGTPVKPVGKNGIPPPPSGRLEGGKLSFIDLAGSERGADTTHNSKQTRMEGAEINTSLLALKEVIRSLERKHGHTPFRGSKLTQVLKDSFVGEKTRTCMIACVSPSHTNCEHTMNTLRYADRVKEHQSGGSSGGGHIGSSQYDSMAYDYVPTKAQQTSDVQVLQRPLTGGSNPIASPPPAPAPSAAPALIRPLPVAPSKAPTAAAAASAASSGKSSGGVIKLQPADDLLLPQQQQQQSQPSRARPVSMQISSSSSARVLEPTPTASAGAASSSSRIQPPSIVSKRAVDPVTATAATPSTSAGSRQPTLMERPPATNQPTHHRVLSDDVSGKESHQSGHRRTSSDRALEAKIEERSKQMATRSQQSRARIQQYDDQKSDDDDESDGGPDLQYFEAKTTAKTRVSLERAKQIKQEQANRFLREHQHNKAGDYSAAADRMSMNYSGIADELAEGDVLVDDEDEEDVDSRDEEEEQREINRRFMEESVEYAEELAYDPAALRQLEEDPQQGEEQEDLYDEEDGGEGGASGGRFDSTELIHKTVGLLSAHKLAIAHMVEVMKDEMELVQDMENVDDRDSELYIDKLEQILDMKSNAIEALRSELSLFQEYRARSAE